jgi:hypothetical protein
MKNAIKKMKWAIIAFGLLLGFGLALTLRADIPFFWLDHPSGRNNPNDPLSPFYSSPTPKVTVALGSPTDTPTVSATPTFTALPGTVTDSPTPSASPTASLTPTPSPTFTAVVEGGWPLVFGTYNGASVPLSSTSGTIFSNNGSGYASATSMAGGPGSDTFYAALSLSCAAATSSAVGEFTTGYTALGAPNPQDALSGYNALSISVELTNSSVVPAVSLVTIAGSVTKTSMVVSLEPYILGGAQFMADNTWYTAVVPLQAFYGPGTVGGAVPSDYSTYSSGEIFTYSPPATVPDDGGVDGSGFNGQAVPYGATVTAADMAAVFGVNVLPTNYTFTPAAGSGTPPPAAGGLALTTYNIDDIVFVDDASVPTLTSSLAPGQAAFGMTAMLCDFDHGAQTNWGTYWSSFSDGDADNALNSSSGDYGICGTPPVVSLRTFPVCTNCPVTGAPSLATINPPVDGTTEGGTQTGNDPTPSDFGHFSGAIGSQAGTACSDNSTPYSYFGMGAYFLPSNGVANILQILQVGPNYGSNARPIGIQLDIKGGPVDTNCGGSGCEHYYLLIEPEAEASQGSGWPGTELHPTSTWQTVKIPFPANGTVLTTNGTVQGGDSYAFGAFSQPSWAGVPYTWDASGTATDTLENLVQFQIEADERGVPVDFEVDNIAFYYAAGAQETPALRKAAAVKTKKH